MKALRLATFLVGMLSLLAPATLQAVVVSFARDDYVVLQGDSICLDAVINFEPGDPGTPDLFSYGVRVDGSSIPGVSVDAITVPLELNFNGFVPGALIDLDPNVIGAKGNVQVPPGTPYTRALVATFQLTFQALGQFALDLALYEILGPTEDVFLAGDSTVLDDLITFEGSSVSVVESPMVAPPEVTLPGLPAPFFIGADIHVRFKAVEGFHYTIQTSLDLEHWSNVETIAGNGRILTFTHVGAGSAPSRFYRVIVVGPES